MFLFATPARTLHPQLTRETVRPGRRTGIIAKKLTIFASEICKKPWLG
jgi:hypothetical protein